MVSCRKGASRHPRVYCIVGHCAKSLQVLVQFPGGSCGAVCHTETMRSLPALLKAP